uniref:Reverse transcriptase Ty1/copia-type domain-containing protein n=1 Tax=Glossina palpalis gambiensis TaxID=67801 RepID=A0A1B0B2F6_9MUSC
MYKVHCDFGNERLGMICGWMDLYAHSDVPGLKQILKSVKSLKLVMPLTVAERKIILICGNRIGQIGISRETREKKALSNQKTTGSVYMIAIISLYYLGMEIIAEENRIRRSQSAYVRKLLEKFNMVDSTVFVTVVQCNHQK